LTIFIQKILTFEESWSMESVPFAIDYLQTFERVSKDLPRDVNSLGKILDYPISNIIVVLHVINPIIVT
jgi:hypothetical protein